MNDEIVEEIPLCGILDNFTPSIVLKAIGVLVGFEAVFCLKFLILFPSKTLFVLILFFLYFSYCLFLFITVYCLNKLVASYRLSM